MFIYCPYIDTIIPKEQASPEHILPLALGGINGFEIPVSAKFNTDVGSRVDGKLSNDFLIALRRNKYDVRGHSRKKPVVKLKKSKLHESGLPLNITINQQDKLKIWSPREGKELLGQQVISSTTKIDMDIDLQFVAKVALGAGYFAYGDLFKEHVEHNELRLIMNHSPPELQETHPNLTALVDHRFSGSSDPTSKIYRRLCEGVSGSSIVLLVPGPTSLTIVVGILGSYLGAIKVSANTDSFPNESAYQLGHVICVQNEKLIRISFHRALEKLQKALG